MRIEVTGRHVEVPGEVKAYVEEKVRKLSRFYDRIQEVEVVFGHESEQFTAEMIVRANQKQTFVARGTGADTYALIDGITDKLERQLVKHKEKNRNRKHDSTSERTGEAADEE